MHEVSECITLCVHIIIIIFLKEKKEAARYSESGDRHQ